MCRSGLICSELSGWLREGLCEWLCIWDLTQREIYLESINILLRLNTQNTQWSFLKTSQTSDYRHRNIFLCLLYLKYCTPPPRQELWCNRKISLSPPPHPWESASAPAHDPSPTIPFWGQCAEYFISHWTAGRMWALGLDADTPRFMSPGTHHLGFHLTRARDTSQKSTLWETSEMNYHWGFLDFFLFFILYTKA